MKSVIYARVSTKDQAEEGFSLPAQEKLLTEYAERRGIEVARKFVVPESASGKFERKTFGEMMEYVRGHGIPAILVEKVDRLTRNFKDAVAINDWIEEDEGRQVHFVKQSLVIAKNAKSHEKFQWDIHVVLARNYIRNLSEEVKKGHLEKLKQGWLPLFRPKYGYKAVVVDGKHLYDLDEGYVPFIRRMFELFAIGQHSIQRLVEIMYEEGLRTRKGERMSKTKLHVILSDPFYRGINVWNGQRYPGKHKLIFPVELFDQVQEVLSGHRNGGPRYRKHNPVFKGLIRCAHCTGLYSWQLQKGHWYGSCNYYRKCDHRTFVRQEAVEEQIAPLLERLSKGVEPFAEWIKDALKENHQAERELHDAAVAQLKARHAQLQRRLDALYDDKLDGRVTVDMYDRKFKEFTEERERVVADIQRHDQANTNYFELASGIIDLARRAGEIYRQRSETEKRQLLALTFSNLKMDREKLLYEYEKPFALLAQTKDFSSKRAGRDSNP